MICLIFGDTSFPAEILKNIKIMKKKYFIIDLSRHNIFKKDKNSYKISIGQFGKMINLIKEKKCQNVLFAGKIVKPKFSNLRMDFKCLYYMPKIIKASKSGDAAIIKVIINILKKEKINVIDSLTFNSELSLKSGNYSINSPSKEDIVEIKKGQKFLNKLNAYNHVQGLVIRDGKVLKIETSYGTKKMLQSIKPNKVMSGILIKLPKKQQDLRIDLPTIGFDTLSDCKRAGLKGVVLKHKQNIFLDKEKCIKFANENKIFINII
jgi:UDP-2,3-diacylglucosamine hydrolase